MKAARLLLSLLIGFSTATLAEQQGMLQIAATSAANTAPEAKSDPTLTRVRGAPGKNRRRVSLAQPKKPIFDAKPIVELKITGVWGYLQENVIAYLDLKRIGDRPSEEVVQRFYRTAPKKIQESMQAVGYYHATSVGSITRRNGIWYMHFDVDRGKPIAVDKVDIQIIGEGATDKAFTNYLRVQPLHEHAVLDHGKYESVKASLSSIAATQGYFDAKFLVNELHVNLAESRGQYILHFDTGQRYKFGKVTFTGSRLRNELLHRYVNFKPGEWYKSESLLKLESALTASGYFQTVDVRLKPEAAADREIPVDIKLTPDNRQKYSLGMGYGTDTGIRGSASVENRQLNNRGHRLGAAVQANTKKTGASAWYDIPLTDPANDKFSVVVDWSNVLDDPKGEGELYAITGKRVWLPRPTWQQTVYLSLKNYHNFNIGSATQEQSELVVLPGLEWVHRRADNLVSPMRGRRWGLEVYGTDPRLGTTEISFVQVHTDAKWIDHWRPRLRTLVRGELGMTLMNARAFDETMPPEYRFAAGGDQSVRGYAFDTLGPRNEKNNFVGGRSLLVGSVEQEVLLGEEKRWRLAAFFDVGNAVNSFDDVVEFKRGVGVGIRWVSPIGPIRLDYARALNPAANEKSAQLHISMGPDL